MIHDGNRPMVSQDIITDNIVKQKINGSAVAVIPTSEVVFVSKDGFKSKEALKRRRSLAYTNYLTHINLV